MEEITLPTREEFFLSIGLYQKYKFINIQNPLNIQKLQSYFFSLYKNFDCYCVSCKKISTFKQINVVANPFNTRNILPTINTLTEIRYECTRVNDHEMLFILFTTDDSILKVGQYPSLADISKPELLKYRKVLNYEKYLELIKGVGLYAHGSGIGSFVYLRRIFETLIEDARNEVVSNSDLDENEFKLKRMDEKVKILADRLPSFLVKNSKLYSILSYGVHQLSESQCMKFFPLILKSIELILDEKLNELERQNKESLTSKDLDDLHRSLSEEV